MEGTREVEKRYMEETNSIRLDCLGSNLILLLVSNEIWASYLPSLASVYSSRKWEWYSV